MYTTEKMTPEEALEYLADGHQIITVSAASQICTLFGVQFDAQIMSEWKDQRSAWEIYGIWPVKPGPGNGAGTLELAYSISQQLGMEYPGRRFTGRGYQARENARVLGEYLKKKEEKGTIQ